MFQAEFKLTWTALFNYQERCLSVPNPQYFHDRLSEFLTGIVRVALKNWLSLQNQVFHKSYNNHVFLQISLNNNETVAQEFCYLDYQRLPIAWIKVDQDLGLCTTE